MLLEDGTPYAHEGTLEFQDVTVESTTGSVTLRMVFPNPDHVLLPGMFVRAIVEEGVNEHAILAPQQGVSRDPRGNAVALVLGADGKVQERTLQLGRALGNKWLVEKGLSEGDRLIVDGLQSVRAGVPAKGVPAGTNAALRLLRPVRRHRLAQPRRPIQRRRPTPGAPPRKRSRGPPCPDSSSIVRSSPGSSPS